MNTSNHVVALTTCPDEASAKHIAMQLLQQNLAAGINILPGMTSCYWWQGAIQTEAEWLLIIYTRRELLSSIETLLQQDHPYEVPALVMLPILSGTTSFLNWISEHAKLD